MVVDNSLEVSVVQNSLLEEIHELLKVTSLCFLIRELEASSLYRKRQELSGCE